MSVDNGGTTHYSSSRRSGTGCSGESIFMQYTVPDDFTGSAKVLHPLSEILTLLICSCGLHRAETSHVTWHLSPFTHLVVFILNMASLVFCHPVSVTLHSDCQPLICHHSHVLCRLRLVVCTFCLFTFAPFWPCLSL